MPVEGDTVNDKATVPVKPFTGVTVIVEVPVAPASVVTLVGLAMTVNSVGLIVTVTVAVCDNVPLVPVMVTVYVPLTVAVHDRVLVPEPATLVGVRVHARPVDGDIVAVRLTTPLKSWRPVTVIVEVSAVFTLPVTEVGLAVKVKS